MQSLSQYDYSEAKQAVLLWINFFGFTENQLFYGRRIHTLGFGHSLSLLE